MGLDDPTKKMSKSTEQPGHAIALLDAPQDIRAKIARATTDSLRGIRFDEDRPGVSNLLGIYQSFTGLSRGDIEARFEGKGYSDLKRELADVIVSGLGPLQARYRELAGDPGHLDAILEDGEMRVSPLAEMTLARARERMGLG
jgi:tryptophanyl-tRNA synthetase